MKVLLNDGLDKEGIEIFARKGIEADVRKRSLDELVRDIPAYDALVVRSATTVTGDVLDAGAKGNLKIIGRAGVGYDNIDVDAATRNGIIVKFAPYGNTNAAAELAFGLMLAVARHIPQAHGSLKAGTWRKKPYGGVELAGKTLGIIGCGRIGQRLAGLARGFDMNVLGYDVLVNPDSAIKYLPKDDVLAKADIVSVHAGGSSVVIGERELGLMKPAAYLINTSRGSNVDEQALYRALKDCRIAGAGLDVFSEEPQEGGAFTSTFRELDTVVLTSHLGASTAEAQRKTSVEMARVVADFLTKGDFSNAVNTGDTVEAEQKPVYPLFVFHQDVPGAFAAIDRVLADSGVNIRENPSRQIGRDGNVMTVYLIHQPAGPDVLDRLRALPVVRRVL